MNGGSLLIRSGSNICLQQQNGYPHTQATRRPAKVVLSNVRERERILPFICRRLSRGGVAMLLLVALALLVFLSGSFTVQKDIQQTMNSVVQGTTVISSTSRLEDKLDSNNSHRGGENSTHNISLVSKSGSSKGYVNAPGHPCDKFAFPPPPPTYRRRPGPRPCPVCYIPVEQATASMPSSPSVSPVLHNLTYVHDENPIKSEPYGGSDFGGYPSLEDRSNSYNIRESMTVHCGFVKGNKPGQQSGFDIDETDIMELEQYHDVIVASAIFGNYDIIQQPKKISEETKKRVPFYMFIDEETEMYMKNSSKFDGQKRVGLWRIIVVRNIPYADARRNGKIPKLLLHRIFPNVRYSIWIDGKLKLVADPYQILERFLWRENASLAISRHYRRFDVFEEAEANKAAGKYDNSSIDEQIQFYENYDGLTHYSEAKLPITSDVPEGCVIIREHIPITNLFNCLWFNEVDRFTSRDQLSFSTVRDKIMSKVRWSTNMFLDCERRNFVIQAYHRELLEHMPPPVSVTHRTTIVHRSHAKKNTTKHNKKGEKRSKRHRKHSNFDRVDYPFYPF